jgi:hypothetical protein
MMPMIGRTFERRGLLLVPTDPTDPTDPTNPNPEWFNSLPVERKKEVMADGLGVRLLDEGLLTVMPIFWLGVDEEAGGKLTNGTVFLVDCGQGVFAVTAAHVYTAYCEAKHSRKEVACQIGDMLFDPEAHLIDCDVREGGSDIATFGLSPDDVAKDQQARSPLQARRVAAAPCRCRELRFLCRLSGCLPRHVVRRALLCCRPLPRSDTDHHNQ